MRCETIHLHVFWFQKAKQLQIDAKWIDDNAGKVVSIVFVVDESSSVGEKNFEICKDFIKNFLDYFSLAPGFAQVFIFSYIIAVLFIDGCVLPYKKYHDCL